MKKWIALVLCCLLLAGSASAEHMVATGLAIELDPENLVSVAFDAKIEGYADGAFTVTILVPERYDPEDIGALQVGDGIYTQGREVEIRSISDVDGYLVFNEGAEDEVYLFESVDLNYWIMDVNDNTWLEVATVSVPASEKFIFLDGIDPVTGEGLLHPTVHNLEGFLELLGAEDDPGFDIYNVEAVTDEEGKLAVIRRLYVPWQ